MVEMARNILINSSYLPTKALVEQVKLLSENQAMFNNGEVVAFFAKKTQEEVNFDTYEQFEFEDDVIKIDHTWDIFSKNGEAIEQDFQLLTHGRRSQPIPEGVRYLNREHIFIERVRDFVRYFERLTGPIYIGKGAKIMEGSIVRGPFAMCENSVLKIGAKIYGYHPRTLL